MGLRMLVDEEAFQPPKAPSKGSSKAPKPGGGGGSGGGDVEGGAAADAINVHLPPEVRVFAVQKASAGAGKARGGGVRPGRAGSWLALGWRLN